MKHENKRPTLCWHCKNAVPTGTSGCSWSRDFQPVKGWVADAHNLKTQSSGRHLNTYCVIYCPQFQKDNANSAVCKDAESCLRLAEVVLQKQMDRYRAALVQYAKTRQEKFLIRLRNIERDLLTPYYAAMGMHQIDFRAICNAMRRDVGLPKLEDGVQE